MKPEPDWPPDRPMELDDCLALIAWHLDTLERDTLEMVAANAIAAGCNAAGVRGEVERYRDYFNQTRALRMATAEAMLEAGVTELQ